VGQYGLADGCPRCAEHAEHPLLSLDRRVLASLIDRVRQGRPAFSENDAVALGKVRDIIEGARYLQDIGHQQLGIELFSWARPAPGRGLGQTTYDEADDQAREQEPDQRFGP
jgi:hypothetical protein